MYDDWMCQGGSAIVSTVDVCILLLPKYGPLPPSSLTTMSIAVDEALASRRSVEGDPRGEQWYEEVTQAGNGTRLEQLAVRWSDDTRANARVVIFELLSKGGALIGGLVLLYVRFVQPAHSLARR
jgi:hypothetical protein